MADKRDRPMNPFTGGYHSPAGEVIQEGIRKMQAVTETAKALFKKKAGPPPTTKASSITRNLDEARQLKQLELEEGEQFSGR